MPLYKYICEHCGHSEEKIQTIHEAEKTPLACPKCGVVMKRQVGNLAHFEFKGNMK